MKTENPTDIGEKAQPTPLFKEPKIKINETRQMIIMCPASIFAKRRIINANGLVKILSTSTNTSIGLTPAGTGGLMI